MLLKSAVTYLIAIFFVVELHPNHLYDFRSMYARACSFASISSLLSLLDFVMGMNTKLHDIRTYYVLDFLQTKAPLTIKGEESRKSTTRPPSWKFLVSSICLINWNWYP